MSRFSQRGNSMQRCLQDVTLRWRQIRGILIVDSSGLPLASTLHSQSLQERLAAWATLGIGFADRARDDLETGSLHLLHLTGQDRQLFMVSVQDDVHLVALAEADAASADIQRQLLVTVKNLLDMPEPTPEAEPEE